MGRVSNLNTPLIHFKKNEFIATRLLHKVFPKMEKLKAFEKFKLPQFPYIINQGLFCIYTLDFNLSIDKVYAEHRSCS